VSRYIVEHRAQFGVEPICRTLAVLASAYRASDERSLRAVQDERLADGSFEVHRPVWRALARPAKSWGAIGWGAIGWLA
jgi:hypothetical protein